MLSHWGSPQPFAGLSSKHNTTKCLKSKAAVCAVTFLTSGNIWLGSQTSLKEFRTFKRQPYLLAKLHPCQVRGGDLLSCDTGQKCNPLEWMLKREGEKMLFWITEERWASITWKTWVCTVRSTGRESALFAGPKIVMMQSEYSQKERGLVLDWAGRST